MLKNVAGIDVGAKKIFTSIDKDSVVCHYTYTEDLKKLRDYLLENKIESVAMEATGVYWVILYEMLEAAGMDVWLVDGRQTKQVPGRKTDVKDCQWIRELHSFGLLNRCMVLDSSIKELQSYVRLRDTHIEDNTKCSNRMNKSLILMNIRLGEVINSIISVSGLEIIKAILDGERDREILTNLCHNSILKKKKELVLKSLDGKYTKPALFGLKQAYNAYMFNLEQINECDKEIEKILSSMGNNGLGQLHKKRKNINSKNLDIQNLGANLLNIFEGKDATEILGISDYNWMKLLSEVGTDLSKWETSSAFTSWLGVAPRQNNSGKSKRNTRFRNNNRAGQIFRIAAQVLLTSKNSAIGAFGRRIRARKGSQVAIKAMARKLAVLYWRIMVKGLDYVEKGIKHYEDLLQENKLRSLKRLAKDLDVKLLE